MIEVLTAEQARRVIDEFSKEHQVIEITLRRIDHIRLLFERDTDRILGS